MGSDSANQTLPSSPALMSPGEKATGNSVTWPLGVIRPIFLPRTSVNQRLPSGPAVISAGTLLSVRDGVGNTVTWPEGVIRPTW